MLKEDVKTGMKVVPFQKTPEEFYGLENSNNWRSALVKNQNYLFVINWDEDEEAYILGCDNDGRGDYFNPEDFELYRENELKDKLLRLQKLYKEMMELQYEINGEFHNKPIFISPEIDGSWKDDGLNLKINRVDIRTDDVGILFDVIEDGEKIECIDGIGFNQFIKNVELL